jgi:hypothetical protein
MVIGIFLRPVIVKYFKKYLNFQTNEKRFEIEFKIEFYSQPSIHHVGEQGMLVKTDPIKIQVDAKNADEALDMVDLVVKQEVKSELVSIKEINKL